MRTPTWGEVEAFLKADGGWRRTRQTKHDFFEKVLPDGTVLTTHVSHARSKTMHPDTFATIRRMQLRVTADDFWETLRSGKSARSGSVEVATAKQPTLAMVMELKRKLHLDDADLEGMTLEEAKRRLDEFHSRPSEEQM